MQKKKEKKIKIFQQLQS